MADTSTLFGLVGTIVVGHFVFRFLLSIYIHFFRAGKNLKKYGEWAVVTGATDGIGKAFAFELARKGLKVLIISRTQSKLDETKKEIEEKFPGSVETLAIDYSSVTEADVKALKEAVKNKQVGILINNVGMSYPHPQFFSELDDKTVRDLLALNIESLVTTTRAILPGMESRKRGAIVNISSASGRFASPLLTEYSATKSFVETFSRGLASEVAGKGIHVQVQSPLYVTTKLAKKRYATWDTPSPTSYARAAVRQIGYETVASPWWAHDLILWVITSLPESVSSRIVHKLHLDIRRKALKKAEKQN